MPEYSYKCPTCGSQKIIFHIITGTKVVPYCRECETLTEMKRDYRADRPYIAPVAQAIYVPAVGAEVSDQKQMDAHLRRLTRESEDKLGYTPKLRARHPRDVEREDPGYGPAIEAREKASRGLS